MCFINSRRCSMLYRGGSCAICTGQASYGYEYTASGMPHAAGSVWLLAVPLRGRSGSKEISHPDQTMDLSTPLLSPPPHLLYDCSLAAHTYTGYQCRMLTRTLYGADGPQGMSVRGFVELSLEQWLTRYALFINYAYKMHICYSLDCYF